ncbi:uncharacterized protein TNCV_3411101 [Trichonephila clavipes]|nr:uncharacterized protein TNCV_3411101 [Trichonephila clavipes]
MSKSKELSEFDRGSIVGCHLCGKSVREIEDILQKPTSTVSDVIVEWKRRGTAHKPDITPKNAKHRLQWCRAHRHWTVDMWKTVVRSDESRFTV